MNCAICDEFVVVLRAKLARGETTADVAKMLAFLEGKGKGVRFITSTENPTRTSPENVVNASRSTSISRSTSAEVNFEVHSAVQENLKESIGKVWEYWRAKANVIVDMPPRVEEKITDRLAYGFSVEQLRHTIDRVVADPALLKRTNKRLPVLNRILASDVQVCRILELPYKPKDRYTWLTPFDKAWQLRFQATLNHGAFAHHAARLLAKHDQAHVLAEFTAYINRTDLDYISWPKFASGFGAWGTARRSGKGRDGLNTGNIDSVWDGNI